MELMNRHLIKAHFGQSMDLFWSKRFLSNGMHPFNDHDHIDRIKQIYALKTGAPIQGLAESAAVISKTNRNTRRLCSHFAQELGIAFQIIDDIQNFSESNLWGKTPGEDLIEGKITYVIASCIQQVDSSERTYLLDFMKNPLERHEPEKLAAAIGIVRNSGVFETCRNTAVAMLNESWRSFGSSLLPSDSKIILKALSDYLVNKPLP